MQNKTKLFMLILLIVTDLLMVGISPIWLGMAGLSFMVFDQGVTAWGVVFVLIFLSLPVDVLILAILSWLFYRRNRLLAAFIANLPLIIIFFGLLTLLGVFDFSE